MNVNVRHALVVAGLLLLAGCASAQAPAASPNATPAPPPAASTTSVASQINSAAEAECAQFKPVAQQVLQTSQVDVTVGELVGSLNASGSGWNSALESAGNIAKVGGVPQGENAANDLAVDLDEVALSISFTQMSSSMGQYSKINGDWTKVIREMAKAQEACNDL